MKRAANLDRDATLDAIMRTFWAHGYEASSLGKLEAATGLKRQSLYNAFGDKAAMFAASLDRYRQQIGAGLRERLSQDDPALAIRGYLQGHADFLSDPALPPGCLIANCSSELGPRDDALGLGMRNEAEVSLGALVGVFSDWQAAGKLRPEAEPEILAALLATIVRGLGVLGRSSGDRVPVDRAVDGAIQAFLPFLSSSPEKE